MSAVEKAEGFKQAYEHAVRAFSESTYAASFSAIPELDASFFEQLLGWAHLQDEMNPDPPPPEIDEGVASMMRSIGSRQALRRRQPRLVEKPGVGPLKELLKDLIRHVDGLADKSRLAEVKPPSAMSRQLKALYSEALKVRLPDPDVIDV